MRITRRIALFAATTLLTFLVPKLLSAQPVTKELRSAADGTTFGPYWTAARMRAAKPVEPPRNSAAVAPDASSIVAPKAPNGTPEIAVGAPPALGVDQFPAARRLAPGITPEQMQQMTTEAPEATSQFGMPFTTSQVQPGAALTTYPFSAAGKLFFSEPSGDYVCSASVIRLRIVVTAGHCVASPASGTAPASFFSNWVFVPAYNNGNAPFGMWTPWAVGTTTEWYYGDGSVPNAQDVGMLIMNDQGNAQIGVWVGYLGYKTNSLAGNDVTMLGYPCNLDNCEIMERTDAGNGISGGNNTYEFGSAAGGGASGGPWVQDFGTPPTSTGAGNQNWALGGNYLIAVTSYGPTGSQGYLGASDLDSSFTGLLNMFCTAAPGNC